MKPALCSNGCCRECDACAAKPGSPTLCPDCLRRRATCPARLMAELAAMLGQRGVEAAKGVAERVAAMKNAEALRHVAAALGDAIACPDDAARVKMLKGMAAACSRAAGGGRGQEEGDVKPTKDDMARDLLADLKACDAASLGPWSVVEDPSGFRRLMPAVYGPDDTVIERPPQSRAEAMEVFYEIILIGRITPADAAFIAMSRTALPAWIRRALAAEARVATLEAEIRRHRDERGDDRCHADDGRLYAVLPEGDTRPKSETAVTLENCEKYIECRQTGREYVSPQRRIEELEALLRRLVEAAEEPDGMERAWLEMQAIAAEARELLGGRGP